MGVTHAQPPSMSASIELEAVKRELIDLESKERQTREHLSRISSQTAQQLQAAGGGSATLDIAERPLPNLLQEATILDAGVKYLDALEVIHCLMANRTSFSASATCAASKCCKLAPPNFSTFVN